MAHEGDSPRENTEDVTSTSGEDFSFLGVDDGASSDQQDKPKKHKGNRYSHKPDAIRKRKAYRAAQPPKKRGRKPGSVAKVAADGTPLRKGRLAIKHHTFIEALLKDPSNQAAAYRAAYPNANDSTARTGAWALIQRPDVSAEIERRRNISTAQNARTRAGLEKALGDIFEFDMRRFFYSEAEARELKVVAGAPKKPHHLDAEAARVLESYEESFGKHGRKVKLKSSPRMAAAELMARLKGWLKDDGRPPITANFQFNFGSRPHQERDARVIEPVEAVPSRLFGAMGLRDESERAEPITTDAGDDGAPPMPPGYEPQRARGVRIASKGRELADAMDQVGKESEPK